MLHLFPSRTVALELVGMRIHWYGLLYLLGFLIAWWLLPHLQKERKLSLTHDDWAGILSAAVLGVIIGGRLGYVLFYQPDYYLRHPFEIIAVWQGGMSSHGGFIGVVIALLFSLRHRSKDILAIADVVVIPVAIGLALGRVGNFINQELYGTVTALPWGIAIPGVEGLRHPTQIYAVIKDLLIAGLCFWHLRSTAKHFIAGRTFVLFLILYGALRFALEFLREQDQSLILSLSRGQLLTVPLCAAGVLLWRWTQPKR